MGNGLRRENAAFAELDALLVGEDAGMQLLAHADSLASLLPVIGSMAECPQNTPFHIYDVLEHTAHVVDASPATSLSRWAALLHDCGKPECRYVDASGRDHFKGHAAVGARIAQDELSRIGAPRPLSDDICTLVRMHEYYAGNDNDMKQVLDALGGRIELYRALISLQIADSSAKAPGVTERLESALRTRERLEQIAWK